MKRELSLRDAEINRLKVECAEKAEEIIEVFCVLFYVPSSLLSELRPFLVFVYSFVVKGLFSCVSSFCINEEVSFLDFRLSGILWSGFLLVFGVGSMLVNKARKNAII